MATGPEHYRKAEQQLDSAAQMVDLAQRTFEAGNSAASETAMWGAEQLVMTAQVHAQLATAAALGSLPRCAETVETTSPLSGSRSTHRCTRPANHGDGHTYEVVHIQPGGSTS